MAYNNPITKKMSPCKRVVNERGKPNGLMMEGSVNYMSMLHQETDKQEKENLEGPEGKNPIDDKASAVEMSPYKMGHDGVPMHGPLHDGHKDSAMPMEHKGVSMKYDSPVPAHTPLHEGHDDSPAMFTGMSGGSGLHNNDPYSRAAMRDKVFADAKKEKYSRSNPQHAGSNFFPPKNPKDKKNLIKGKTTDQDLASIIYDADQDGDSIFRDYNQDGTMVGRGIQALINRFRG